MLNWVLATLGLVSSSPPFPSLGFRPLARLSSIRDDTDYLAPSPQTLTTNGRPCVSSPRLALFRTQVGGADDVGHGLEILLNVSCHSRTTPCMSWVPILMILL